MEKEWDFIINVCFLYRDICMRGGGESNLYTEFVHKNPPLNCRFAAAQRWVLRVISPRAPQRDQMPVFRRNLPTSSFMVADWADSSWLAAADCSAVAELVCTTAEI